MQQRRLDHIDDALKAAASTLAKASLSSLMHEQKRSRFICQFEDLIVDYTRQPLDESSLACLLDLAKECHIQQRIDEMFSGAAINTTENLPVQHVALRRPDYQSTLDYERLVNFAEMMRKNQNIESIVNLGIGGSELGPKMVIKALTGYHDGPASYFVGNICPTDLNDVLAKCDPHKTLFIVTSKSFTTPETLTNATLAGKWLKRHGVDADQAMVAVTAFGRRAQKWGIDSSHVFPFAEGIGGRFSLWSSVGLSVMIAIGSANFSEMLAGAHAMDCHIQQAELEQNIGVIMGLLRVWHRSFLNRSAYGLIPYDQRLAQLPAWAQQLEMESNGKAVDRQGHNLQRPAGPLIWGAPGTSAQHSFFQWLHQSVDVTPIDILVAMQPAAGLDAVDSWESHKLLVINAVAQAEALALGKTNTDEPHRHFTGNRPSVLISWNRTTPYTLGRLLALYEHITVISGFIWDVNSFDQWGVEFGKDMANQFDSGMGIKSFSPSAQAFLHRLNKQ